MYKWTNYLLFAYYQFKSIKAEDIAAGVGYIPDEYKDAPVSLWGLW